MSGFERLPNAKSEGGTYEDDVPWRFVTHTTEVIPSSIAGARGLAMRHEFPPHLWVWPEERWKAQTVRLDRAAFALKHPAGTPATNKMRALQVEIIGYASRTPVWPLEWWDWLGREVLRPVIEAGYFINLNHVAPTTGQDGAGTGGTVRMSRSEWRSFDGLCCHANVPDNSHWDIGAGRLPRMAAAARPAPPVPTTKEREMYFLSSDQSAYVWFFEPGRRTLMQDAEERAEVAKASGIPNHVAEVSPGTFSNLAEGRTVHQ